MRIETKCLQEGYKPGNGEPRMLPIYQSTTYRWEDSEKLGDLFDLKTDGHMYTRISNPTFDAVEKKIAALEGGTAALLTSSGQAATLIAVLNITSAGDNILCSSSVYGGTTNLLAVTLKRLGIETRFFSLSQSDAELEAMIDERTRLVFGETIANPALTVFDIERYANLAHRNGLPLFVDNTFATPILCRPFEYGADIITHSTTKYIDGHACSIGGCVVEGGRFDWEKGGKYPELSEPDESYHGVVYTKQFGNTAFTVKARQQLMRDLGAIPSPFNAFLFELGSETLHLRMERHSQNALAVAKHLEKCDEISWVSYPALPSSPNYELAKKYLPLGASGVISYGVKGGREAAMKFMNSLKLAAIVVHVADAHTSVIHPASTTHRQLTDEQLIAGGITPDLVRMSVGIENVDDIIEDLDQALSKI